MSGQLMSIAIDDTDSQYGGCTTHLTGILLSQLRDKAELADYPLLVRLNPNIPWKTRGNAATVLRLWYDGSAEELLDLVWPIVEEYTSPRPPLPGKRPGVVVLEGKPWENPALRWLYSKALSDVVTLDVVEGVIDKAGALWRGGRGLIGAASAMAALAPGDPYTFELTFYRRPELWGSKRCIDDAKVIDIEARSSSTLNNLDLAARRSSAAPGGPDPVLAGFRGTYAGELWKFEDALCERPHFAVLYRSNQHTQVHTVDSEPLIYRAVRVRATVASTPQKLPGGHVIVEVGTEYGHFDVAFYDESGPLRRAAEMLRPGDVVIVEGGVRPYSPRGRTTISAESMYVVSLSESHIKVNPRCPRCGSRMESAGSGKGYRCPRCGLTLKDAQSQSIVVTRDLMPGLYSYRLGRVRHLSSAGVTPPVLQSLPLRLHISDVLKVY